MTEPTKESEQIQCRACGRPERASEGYPCQRCGTFLCVMCNLQGVTRCKDCQARELAAPKPAGERAS